MGHRIKVLRSFVDPADADKIIRLIDAGPQATFVDILDQKSRVLPNTNTASEWMLKRYSDKLIEEHKEEFGWKHHLFTARAHAFVVKSGSDMTNYIDPTCDLDHVITGSIIYLGGDSSDGKIVFPNQEVEYQLEPLSAVIFPKGGWEYQHIVEPSTSGTGYSIAMWHTGNYQSSLQQQYLREKNIALSNLWSANYKAGVCGI